MYVSAYQLTNYAPSFFLPAAGLMRSPRSMIRPPSITQKGDAARRETKTPFPFQSTFLEASLQANESVHFVENF